MPRVIHFEISADDPDRAIAFYEKVFGWKIQKWEGPMDYWLVSTGEADEPGIDGAIMPREPNIDNTNNTIDVDDIDAYMEKIVEAGGKVVMSQIPVPGVGYTAVLQDTEGNTFGLMQGDPDAQ
jgi:predicted enzyme related to lactoylglutathione lyase